MSPRFGFVGPSYQSQSISADNQACINFYPELDESGAGNAPIMLYPTPGLKEFSDLTPPSYVLDEKASLSGTVSLSATAAKQTFGIFLGATDGGFHTTGSSLSGTVGAWTSCPSFTDVNGAYSRYGIIAGGSTATALMGVTTNKPPYEELCGVMALLDIALGHIPVVSSVVNTLGGAWNTNQTLGAGLGVVAAGQTIFLLQVSRVLPGNVPNATISVTDNHNNVWLPLVSSQIQGFDVPDNLYFGTYVSIWKCSNPVVASDYTFQIDYSAGSYFAGSQLGIIGVTELA